MVQKPLFDFLQTTKIVHPTSVKELTTARGTITMQIEGFPWWLDFEEGTEIETSSATLEFTSISRTILTESCLICASLSEDPCSEDLDEFSVKNVSQEIWNKGNTEQVFCSEPIGDPIALLTALEGFLIETDCPFGYSEFIHGSNTLERFSKHTKLSPFLIANGPSAICEIVSKELDRQKVAHTTTQSSYPYATGYIVRWWDGFLICKNAIISWDSTKT